MNLKDLVQRLQAEHHHDPQSCLTISTALSEVEHGLTMLARMGHVYHLTPGPPYELPEWPRVLFHVNAAPNGRVVNSSWEAIELGDGWWPTLQEAQNKEGIRAQFRGRGGVGDRSLPMLMDNGPAAPRTDYSLPSAPNNNHSLIEEWKRSVGSANISDNGPAPGDATATGPVGEHPSEQPTETAVSPSIPPELDVGYCGTEGLGTGSGICVDATSTTDGVPEDAVQGNGLDSGEQHSRRGQSERGGLDDEARDEAGHRHDSATIPATQSSGDQHT